ncbi:MAG: acyl-CoA dehydratase activase-related protein, partial [Chloroflexota bacterium]
QYIHQMHSQKKTPLQMLEESGVQERQERGDGQLTLAILGHPYLLYDDFINHRLISKIQGMGVKVFTPEMVPPETQEAAIAELDGKSYWTYEGEVVGAGGYFIKGEVDEVAGVIGIGAFGCGPDSLMMDLVRRYARDNHKPFLNLTVDEHTAEAGLLTRLEAFVDMLEWQERAR